MVLGRDHSLDRSELVCYFLFAHSINYNSRQTVRQHQLLKVRCGKINSYNPIQNHKFIMTDNPQKAKKSRVKGPEIDLEPLNSSQLNNSSSKMHYSIPKSPRWSEPKKNKHQPPLYALPSLRSNRSAAFGYGNKIDISKLANNSPPPNSYDVHSEFQKKKGKGVGIGLGRELIKAVSTFGEKPFVVPGVGSYQVKDPKTSQTISFSGRAIDLSEKWIRQVPGPGTYETLQLLDKNLKSQNSRFGSARSQKFSKAQIRDDLERQIVKQHIPGPSQYVSEKKNYDIIDRFMQNKGMSFGKSSRPDIANKAGVPGPGSYRHTSDFLG